MQTSLSKQLSTERRATLSLATLFSLRMLGLFMIVPVFALYAQQLAHTTPLLIGFALGCYGLTQALLQIPFGMWSDKIGRKPVIAFGLILFALGSVVAAFSHSIWGIIIGRSLQGAGAVGSTTLALVADLTRPEQRTKAMATIGITIGASFSLAMVLGPILNSWINVNGIFWLTALLAIFGLVILKVWVPAPAKITLYPEVEMLPAKLGGVLRNRELLRLDLGILLLHALLTATFVAAPLALENLAGLPEAKQWWVYFPVLLLAFAAAVPLIIIAEKKQKLKLVFQSAIFILMITELLLWWWQHSVFGIAVSLWLFFTAFTLLEAILPSAVSKIAPPKSKGTAIGIYSSCQFLGIFIGGIFGGWLYGHFNTHGVWLACALMAGFWLCLTLQMQNPQK